MNKRLNVLSMILSCLFLLTAQACGRDLPVRSDNAQPQSQTLAVNTMPDDKDFIGEGSASEFADAKVAVYSDLIKKAAIFILGQQKYDQNQDSISKNFYNFPTARKYVLGETEKTTPDKEKKWMSNVRDASGNLNLRMKAFINIKKLKADLDALSMKEAPAATPAVVTPVTTATASTQTAAVDSSTTTSAAPADDLSNVDISSLTFLVFYNQKDPAFKNDADQANYSKWAVDYINKELANINVQTFDLDTVEKLASERSLLQEASAGSVGVGLLLAQKVFAELYAEITPSVTYEGNKAHVILNLKAYVRTTGALIATIEKGGQQYESASLAASIKMSMREAAKKMKDELTTSLKKYVKNGRFYFVRLTGVQSFKDASKFSSKTGKLDGVVSVTLKSGSKQDQVYDYNVQYKGNPTDLATGIIDGLSDTPGMEKIDLKEIRGNELTLTLD